MRPVSGIVMIRALTLVLVLFLAAVGAGACKKVDCSVPCQKMVECPAKIFGQNPTEKEMAILTQGCSNSCSKHGETMWKCYEQFKDSPDFCMEMFRCAQMNVNK